METKTQLEQEIKLMFPDVASALSAVRSVATYHHTRYIRDVIYGVPNVPTEKKVRLRYEDSFEGVSIDATCKYVVGIENDIKQEIEETLYCGNSEDEAKIAVQKYGTYQEENSYEKIRILFKDQAQTEITLDVYPFGAVAEIEGLPENIHTIASRLGFSPSDYVHKSADELYLAWIAKHDLPEQWDVRFGLSGSR